MDLLVISRACLLGCRLYLDVVIVELDKERSQTYSISIYSVSKRVIFTISPSIHQMDQTAEYSRRMIHSDSSREYHIFFHSSDLYITYAPLHSFYRDWDIPKLK